MSVQFLGTPTLLRTILLRRAVKAHAMATCMLQRAVLGSTSLNVRRPATSSPLGGCRRTACAVTVCSQKNQELETFHVAKLASAALAASLLLSAAVPGDALAARSGGRVGGSSFRSSAPRAAPRASPAPGSRYVIVLIIQNQLVASNLLVCVR